MDLAADKSRASVGRLCGVVVAHDDEREQGYGNGRATPVRVIVVAAFAMVLVSVTWVGDAVALRVVGVVHVLDVLGEQLGPVVHREQMILDNGWCLEREKECWPEVATAIRRRMCRRTRGRGDDAR